MESIVRSNEQNFKNQVSLETALEALLFLDIFAIQSLLVEEKKVSASTTPQNGSLVRFLGQLVDYAWNEMSKATGLSTISKVAALYLWSDKRKAISLFLRGRVMCSCTWALWSRLWTQGLPFQELNVYIRRQGWYSKQLIVLCFIWFTCCTNQWPPLSLTTTFRWRKRCSELHRYHTVEKGFRVSFLEFQTQWNAPFGRRPEPATPQTVDLD